MVSRSQSGKEVIDAMEQLFSEYTSSPSKRGNYLLSKSLSSKQSLENQKCSEVEKIKQLWQRAKFELHAKSRELTKLKALVSQQSWEEEALEETTAEKDRLTCKVKNLQQELDLCKQHLDAARNENQRWALSYERAMQDLQLARKDYNARQNKASAVETENYALKNRVRELENEKQEMLSRSIQDICKHDEDARYQSSMIHEQKQRIVDLEAELAKLRNVHNQACAKIKQLQQDSAAEAVLLRSQEQTIRRANSDSKSGSQLAHEVNNMQARLNHLRVDNERLLELLKSTGAFSTFVELCNDSPETDGCAYWGKSGVERTVDGEALKQELLGFQKSYASKEGCPCSSAVQPDPKTESLNWIPKEALKASAYFKENHLPHVSASVMGSFLRTLNKIWQHREHKKMQKLKAIHHTRLRDLKRQQRQNLPYDQVVKRPYNARARPVPSKKRFGVSSDELKKRFRQLSNTEPALQAYQSLDLESPGATEALLLALEELSAELRLKKENVSNLSKRLEGVSNENLHAALASLRGKISDATKRVVDRIRKCSRRVASLVKQDPDYSILLFRAYNAMMEDIELELNALEERCQQDCSSKLMEDIRFESKCCE